MRVMKDHLPSKFALTNDLLKVTWSYNQAVDHNKVIKMRQVE